MSDMVEETGIEAIPENPEERLFGLDGFRVSTVETWHCHYLVRAESPEQAEKRLRTYLRDPQMMLPGIVEAEAPGERVRWLVRKKLPGSSQ